VVHVTDVGHKSPLVWKRYNSVVKNDLLAAASKLHTYRSNTVITPADSSEVAKIITAWKVWSWREESNLQPVVCKTVNGGLLKYLIKWAIPSLFLPIRILAFRLTLAASDSFLTELFPSLTL